MAARSIKVTLRADVSDFKAQMAASQKSLEDVVKAADKNGTVATTTGGKVVQSAKLQRDAWNSVGTSLLGVGAVGAAAFGGIIATTSSFESQMSAVQAATLATAGEMDVLREAAKQAGADTAFSATEAAQGIEQLAKAGVSTTDILNGGLAGALDLAAAGGVSVQEAAESAASALTQFKLSGEDVPHVADLLAAAAGKAQGGVTEMSQALSQAGLVASNSGLSIEETTGTLAAFASAGLIGSDAGTSFKSMLQRLQNPSKESAAMMDDLGLSLYDANGNMVGMSAMAGQLKSSLGGLTQEARDAALAQIFGSDAVRAATVLYNQGSDGIDKWTAAVDESGYAAETAAARQDNLAGSWEKFTGSAETLAITVGEHLTPILKGVVDAGTAVLDWVTELPGPVLALATGLGGLVTVGGLAAGSFMVLAPRIMDAHNAANELKDTFPKLGGAMDSVTSFTGKLTGKLVKGAAALGAFYAVQQGIQWASQTVAGIDRVTTGVEELQNRLDAASASGENFFDVVVGSIGEISTEQFTDFAEAVERVAQPSNADKLAKLTHLDATGFNDVVDQFENLNDQMSQLAGQNTSKATQQFSAMLKEAGGTDEAFQNLKKVLPGYVEEMYSLANANGINIDSTNELQLMTGLLNNQMTDTASSTGDAADAQQSLTPELDAAADAAQSASDAANAYLEALQDLGEINMSADEALLDYNETLSSTKDLLDDTAYKSADATTQDLMRKSALADLVDAGNDVINTMKDQGAGTEDLGRKTVDLANDFMSQAAQIGVTGDAAVELANRYGRVPSNVHTQAEFEKWVATQQVNNYKSTLDSLDGRVVRTYVTVKTQSVLLPELSVPASVANPSLLQRGTVKKRASGGGIPGFGGGDIVPTLLEPGEFVINKYATRENRALLETINARVPFERHQMGGVAGSTLTPASSYVRQQTQTVVQRVEVPTSLTVVDSDGKLVGRMKVEATRVAMDWK